MTCHFQCAHCQEPLALADQLAGRKVRCPFCGAPRIVPPPGEPGPELERDFAACLAKYRLTPWDRACAQTAWELSLVGETGLRRAVLALRQEEKRQREVSLDQLLMRLNLIAPADAELLVHTVRHETGQGEATRDCPNCFAALPAAARKCPHCGQKFGALELADMCPHCKAEQAPGLKRCRECGADLATGLLPPNSIHVRRCPDCGAEVTDPARRTCPRCRTDLSLDPVGLARARRRERWTRRMYRHGLPMVLALMVVGVGLACWWKQARPQADDRRAALLVRLATFEQSLAASDARRLGEFVIRSGGESGENELLPRLLGLDLGARVRQVRAVERVATNIDADGRRALVYARVELLLAPAPVAQTVSSADLNPAAEAILAKPVKSGQVAWEWVWQGENWFCQL